MYSYQLIRSMIFYVLVLSSLNSSNTNAMISPTPELLKEAAEMVSPQASKQLQEQLKQAEQEVEQTTKQLAKAQQEHDMPGIIKASKAAHEAQQHLKSIQKRLKTKK